MVPAEWYDLQFVIELIQIMITQAMTTWPESHVFEQKRGCYSTLYQFSFRYTVHYNKKNVCSGLKLLNSTVLS